MLQSEIAVLMKRAGPYCFGALLPVLAAIALSACTAGTSASPVVPKAVFIIVDGIPPDALERTPTPALDAISAEGAYTRAYVGGTVGEESESPTISAVGYNSLLTGTWANKHNVWDNSVENPNYAYWDIFRIAKADNPRLVTAIFSTWLDNRTRLVGDGLDEAGGHKIDYHFDGFELDTDRFPHDEAGDYIRQIDAIVVEEAARYIREVGPDLSWVYLQHTDDVAHRYGDGPEFTAAVRLMDSQIGAIWASIRERRASHDEGWLLLVTTDHGRDAQTGKEHGHQSDRERSIWIVTNSRRLNARFFENPGIVDIMPSLADHLGLEIPEPVRAQLDGESFLK
jgi:predicted AlkP superfamily pyrophosphatase or phosphodiesterase